MRSLPPIAKSLQGIKVACQYLSAIAYRLLSSAAEYHHAQLRERATEALTPKGMSFFTTRLAGRDVLFQALRLPVASLFLVMGCDSGVSACGYQP